MLCGRSWLARWRFRGFSSPPPPWLVGWFRGGSWKVGRRGGGKAGPVWAFFLLFFPNEVSTHRSGEKTMAGFVAGIIIIWNPGTLEPWIWMEELQSMYKVSFPLKVGRYRCRMQGPKLTSLAVFAQFRWRFPLQWHMCFYSVGRVE